MTEVQGEVKVLLEGQEQRYVLRNGDVLLFGRGRNVDVHVDDRSVSRRHMRIEFKDDGIYLTDLGSSNGSFLGGHRLSPNVPSLHYGDEAVRLGEVPLALSLLSSKSSGAKTFSVPFLNPDEFDVLGLAGRGGISTVWAARQKILGRDVAIKVLNAPLSDPSGEDYKRFLREARLYTELESPYIVKLHDVRLSDKTPYLILELVRGPSAYARVERDRAMAVPEALKVCEEIALALKVVHEAGMVHRDIKPSNILLTVEGVAKLGDFGLAKHLADVSITAQDMGMGSLPYVAPEQSRSAREVGPAADIYGLGATIYHLIAGHPPIVFDSEENMIMRLERVRNEPPRPLSALREGVPQELSALVDQCLAKEPANRPQLAGILAERFAAIRRSYFPGYRGQASFGGDTWAAGDDRPYN